MLARTGPRDRDSILGASWSKRGRSEGGQQRPGQLQGAAGARRSRGFSWRLKQLTGRLIIAASARRPFPPPSTKGSRENKCFQDLLRCWTALRPEACACLSPSLSGRGPPVAAPGLAAAENLHTSAFKELLCARAPC